MLEGLAELLYSDDSPLSREARRAWVRTLSVAQRMVLLETYQTVMRITNPELFERARIPDWTDNYVILRRDGTIEYGRGTAERAGKGPAQPDHQSQPR